MAACLRQASPGHSTIWWADSSLLFMASTGLWFTSVKGGQGSKRHSWFGYSKQLYNRLTFWVSSCRYHRGLRSCSLDLIVINNWSARTNIGHHRTLNLPGTQLSGEASEDVILLFSDLQAGDWSFHGSHMYVQRRLRRQQSPKSRWWSSVRSITWRFE